ncbi:MAG: slipin family protein [Myxococcales bacterium]|nr:slipin family protein [Myxococcales bacterium]
MIASDVSAFTEHGVQVQTVATGHVAAMFVDGKLAELLPVGLHAFWRGVADLRFIDVDLRERSVDVAGQELMTADRVTLRLNAVVVMKVVDVARSLEVVEDARAAVYREAQLALRAVVGGRDLDALLSGKDEVADELTQGLRARAAHFGVEIVSLGVKDVILPGDMKELLNKVMEARKAAEAAVITRREEVAAMRSQVNTAKLLVENPTLMRLRELEALESVAKNAKLTVVLGEKSLTTQVTNLV